VKIVQINHGVIRRDGLSNRSYFPGTDRERNGTLRRCSVVEALWLLGMVSEELQSSHFEWLEV